MPGDNEHAKAGGAVEPCPLKRGEPLELELTTEDGKPIRGERFEVVSKDKTVYVGRTLNDGSARLDGLVAGDCIVSFYGLDEDAWEPAGVSVLREAAQPPSAGAANGARAIAGAEPAHSAIHGDCIALIADAHGYHPDRVWHDDANASLVKARKSPNILHVGDVVALPAKRRKEVSCATGKRHAFRRLGASAVFKLTLIGDDGAPLKSVDYLLELKGRDETSLPSRKGKTDDDGLITDTIPAAELGTLAVDLGDGFAPYEHTIHLGRLSPASEVLGVQQRLMNLGYPCPQTGSLDANTREALESFQLDYGLPLTREGDEYTQKLLEELHKS